MIASAAASETPPRMPLQAIVIRSARVVCDGSTAGTISIHRNRMPITTAKISSA